MVGYNEYLMLVWFDTKLLQDKFLNLKPYSNVMTFDEAGAPLFSGDQ